MPHDSFQHTSQCGVRCDAIQQFDACVGQIVATLDRLKITDNTLLIVTSDNGPVVDDGYADGSVEALGAHKPAGSLRGGKYSLYEGGTRMPFLASWPARIKPKVSGALVSQVDMVASFAALAGRPLPADAAPDSFNMLPALVGESPQGRDHLVEQGGGLAFRKGQWKLVPADQPRGGAGGLAKNGNTTGTTELYNLAADIGESRNLAAEKPEMVSAMTAEFQKIRTSGRSRP